MANFQSIPWGNTQIRFLPRVLDENKVRAAAQSVPAIFDSMKDSFVAISQDGPQIVAAIPAKPKAKTFPVLTQGIGSQEAIRQALEHVANFLKGRV